MPSALNLFIRNFPGKAELLCGKCFTKSVHNYRDKWSEAKAAKAIDELTHKGWSITGDPINSILCPRCAGRNDL